MGGQGVVEVSQGNGRIGADGLLETAGETVGEEYTHFIAPYIGVTGFVRIGRGN